MKKKNSIIILSLSLVTLVLYLLFWEQIPDEMAIHWNIKGEVDGTGSKILYLFLLLLPVLLLFGGEFLAKIDPKKSNYVKHEKTYWLLIDLIAFVFLVMNWLFFAAAMGIAVDISMAIPCLMGILFLCLGNYLPLIKDNYFFGIRTPWTLADSIVWKKTHRIGGVTFVLAGLLMLVGIFLPQELRFILILGSTLACVLFCFIYSYLCFKKVHQD